MQTHRWWSLKALGLAALLGGCGMTPANREHLAQIEKDLTRSLQETGELRAELAKAEQARQEEAQARDQAVLTALEQVRGSCQDLGEQVVAVADKLSAQGAELRGALDEQRSLEQGLVVERLAKALEMLQAIRAGSRDLYDRLGDLDQNQRESLGSLAAGLDKHLALDREISARFQGEARAREILARETAGLKKAQVGLASQVTGLQKTLAAGIDRLSQRSAVLHEATFKALENAGGRVQALEKRLSGAAGERATILGRVEQLGEKLVAIASAPAKPAPPKAPAPRSKRPATSEKTTKPAPVDRRVKLE